MSTGVVFNIQHFSLHDGPGIRTTVFLKGCPLDCIWCHNPESKSGKPQLAWIESQCLYCGRCEAVCEQKVHSFVSEKDGFFQKNTAFDRCVACGLCVNACPGLALELMGKNSSVEDVIKEVERDSPFYINSNGGMTLSGGEPAFQPAFSRELLESAKKLGIHTAIETSGLANWKVYDSFLPWLDLVLFDIKQMDPEKHRLLTGHSNNLIHENLRKFCSAGCSADVIVRTPVIPGCNDDFENYHALAKFLQTFERCPRVELLPYNPLAGAKHPRIGKQYALKIEESDGLAPELLCNLLIEQGIEAKVLR